ncbi:MAG: hypothetical protein LIP00_09690 [Parabacteroides sp.]|nr:hypothetical protein [Parabacteroides sp.]
MPAINTLFLVALHPLEGFPFIGESQGICAISGYLSARYGKEISVHLYDQQLHSLENIVADAVKYRPALIGISLKMCTFGQFEKFYLLLSARVFPLYRPIVVLGNSTAHFSGEEILRGRYPDVIISLGEGEVSIAGLYKYIRGRKRYEEIKNILYKKNGRIVRSEFVYLDKAEIPVADRRYSALYFQKGGEVYIEGSRGCGYCCCTICECRHFLGSTHTAYKWRDKPIPAIVTEMERLASQGIHTVTFSDEDFFGPGRVGLERAGMLAAAIIRSGIRIAFRVNARVHSVYSRSDSEADNVYKKEVLHCLRRAGLTKIFLGFESGSETQLRRYGKEFVLDEFIRAKAVLAECAVGFELGYISLDPLVSLEELDDSLRFIRENDCIPYLSAVYKELRIQRGNRSYIRKIRSFEQQAGIRLLGALDFNQQMFDVVRYADERVMRLRGLMKKYNETTYKLYYFMRILTQYSQENLKNGLGLPVYRAMEEIKNNDYELMQALVEKIRCCASDSELNDCLFLHREKRQAIYNALFAEIGNDASFPYRYLVQIALAGTGATE